MFENTRIPIGRYAFNTRRKNKQFVIVIDVGNSLGTLGGRDSRPSNAAQNQETRQRREEHLSARLGNPAELFLPINNKSRTKAAISTTYVTFVLYLEFRITMRVR